MEILDVLQEFKDLKISIYKSQMDDYVEGIDKLAEELDKRTIDLGAFIKERTEIFCKELTFF